MGNASIVSNALIKFDLDGAYPDYVPVIISTYRDLAERWPRAHLDIVRTYRPKRGDRSRGNAHNPGEIQLNLFWFAEPPEVLTRVGEVEGSVPRAVLDQDLPWHGGIPQPGQLLTHEFGHVLIQRLGPEIADVIRSMWMEATANPALAPSGYSLVDPDEFGAELFVGFLAGNPRQSPLVNEFGMLLMEAIA